MPPPSPRPEVRREIRLGRQSFTLVFGDEQAKANVNRLYRTGGLAEAERGVRTLAVGTDGVAVELRPLPVPRGQRTTTPTTPRRCSSPSDRSFATPPRRSDRAARRRLPPAAVLTCWGDGSIHFRRASTEALREVCVRHANGAQLGRLLQIRSKRPDIEAATRWTS